MELSLKEMGELAGKLTNNGISLTDNVNFRNKNNSFDAHRILKLPNSIDAATNMCISEDLGQIRTDDRLNELVF